MTSIVSRTRTIITRDDGRFLVKVSNRGTIEAPDRFILFPGGQVRAGEDPSDKNRSAVERELNVTLLDMTEAETFCVRSRSFCHDYIYNLFTAKIDKAPSARDSRRQKEEFFWVHKEALPKLLALKEARYDRGFPECLAVYLRKHKLRMTRTGGVLT